MHIPSRIKSALALLLLVLCSSCTTTHVKMDHTQLRELLMDYTEEQIIDNLIRAKNGRPIMHFDMAHVNALVKTSVSASIGGGHSETTARSSSRESTVERTGSGQRDSSFASSSSTGFSGFSPTASSDTGSIVSRSVLRGFSSAVTVASGVVSTVTNPFSWGASGARDNTVDVQMVPVLNEDGVYEAYEQFVATNGGDTIRDSLHYPIPKADAAHLDDPNGVHVGKKWRGVYYWVPKKYKQKFFKLCMEVALKRPNAAASQSAAGGALLDLGAEVRRLRLSR